MQRPLIYAHRGGAGLWPELTLHAYQNALALGVDCVDLDVHLSQDKVVVVTHDPYISHTLARHNHHFLSQPGPAIRELTVDDIQSYDVGRLNPDATYQENYPEQVPQDGEMIPTLEQVLSLCERQSHRQMHYQIEIKNAPGTLAEGVPPHEIVPRVAEVLKKFHIGKRATIHSFLWENVLLAKSLLPDITTACITDTQALCDKMYPAAKDWYAGFTFKQLGEVPTILKQLQVWNPEGNTLKREWIDQAHAAGIKVIPWTVDNPERMKTLIEAGIDGIITNRPDLMRDILVQLHYPTPKLWP